MKPGWLPEEPEARPLAAAAGFPPAPVEELPAVMEQFTAHTRRHLSLGGLEALDRFAEEIHRLWATIRLGEPALPGLSGTKSSPAGFGRFWFSPVEPGLSGTKSFPAGEEKVESVTSRGSTGRRVPPAQQIRQCVDRAGLWALPAGTAVENVVTRPLPGTALLEPPERLRWHTTRYTLYDVAIYLLRAKCPQRWSGPVAGERPGTDSWQGSTALTAVAWPRTELCMAGGDDCKWLVYPGTAPAATARPETAPYEQIPAAAVAGQRELVRGWFCLLEEPRRLQWQQRRAELERTEPSPLTNITLAWIALEYDLFDDALCMLDEAIHGWEGTSYGIVVSQMHRELFRQLQSKLEAAQHGPEADAGAALANTCLVWTICQMLGNTRWREQEQCHLCGQCGLVPPES